MHDVSMYLVCWVWQFQIWQRNLITYPDIQYSICCVFESNTLMLFSLWLLSPWSSVRSAGILSSSFLLHVECKFCCLDSHRVYLDGFLSTSKDSGQSRVLEKNWALKLGKIKTTMSLFSLPTQRWSIHRARKWTYASKRYTNISWGH